MEILITIGIIAYIVYLAYFGDHRSKSEKEEERLKEGITLYTNQNVSSAFQFFQEQINEGAGSCVAYFYLGKCHAKSGESEQALSNYRIALSLDDHYYPLLLELGGFYFKSNRNEEALVVLNKAVEVWNGGAPAPFILRAGILGALGRNEEAEQDGVYQQAFLSRIEDGVPIPNGVKASFFDRRLLRNLAVTLITSLSVVYSVKASQTIHVPFFVAVLSAILIGFIEPERGWFLALIQAGMIFGGYAFLNTVLEFPVRSDFETFALYGSVILTFAAGFLVGTIRKSIQ